MIFRVLFSIGVLAVGLASVALAQKDAPISPSPASAARPGPAPTTESLINAMGADDVEQALQVLKTNFVNEATLDATELNRATLQGLLTRLGRGVLLLPPSQAESKESSAPFYAEILDGHIGYVRTGSLTAENLPSLDSNLQTFTEKKVNAVVLDLRTGGTTNDFAVAAEFAKRFCAKGKSLFTLRKAAARQERSFISDREPAFTGLLIALTDDDTTGAMEALAGVLRQQNKTLIVGAPTAGRAVEYADLPLNRGGKLRVAVSEVMLPERQPLFPGGLKPDLPVEMPAEEKRQIFQRSLEKGMALFVFENERPHLNEAALLAGKNPELEVMEAAQTRGRAQEKKALRDLVLQRAIDVITSLAVYQRR